MSRRLGRPRSAKPLPTVRSRRLGAELRRLRERAGLTQDDSARVIGRTVPTVSRMETGHRGVVLADLKRLLTEYGVAEDSQHWELMLRLARDVDRQDWWDEHDYSALGPWRVTTYFSLEDEASQLRTYQPTIVPGLLQTADYAQAVIGSDVLANRSPEAIDKLVMGRIKRKEILQRVLRPVSLWAVLDEAALRRLVGSPTVMADQLRHVLDAASWPTVTLQVMPFSTASYPAMVVPFVLIGFPEHADPDVVWIETNTGAVSLEDERNVSSYTVIFDHLRAHALDPRASVRHIEAIAREWTEM